MKTTELPKTLRAGESLEVLIAPLGEYVQYNAEGEAVRQVCDAQAVQALADAFAGEVLVDYDHAAEDGGSTEAAAWITELRAEAGRGLMAVFRFTDAGAEAVTQRRYRFVSPAWQVGEDGRPWRLVSCALTNKPNLPVPPVLNRAAGATQPKGTKMDKIKEALGLDTTATEDDILTAIGGLQKQVNDLTAEKADAEAEAFATENSDKVADVAVLRNAYLKDPELAKAILANCKLPETKPVCNKQAAKLPSFATRGGTQSKYQAWHEMPDGPAKDAYLDAHADEINDSAPSA